MIFTADQTGRWAGWMYAETEYALAKFPESEQSRYFDLGVTRGDFSIEMSAVGYFKRAALRSGSLALHETIALKAVQEVGKSAHNHLACGANALRAFGLVDSHDSGIRMLVHKWSGRLRAEGVDRLALDTTALSDMSRRFAELQLLQDASDAPGFMSAIEASALPVHATFVSMAEEYGWPQPGVSSSEDVSVWAAQEV